MTTPVRHVIFCEDSPEHILSAVHFAYTRRYGHARTQLRTVRAHASSGDPPPGERTGAPGVPPDAFAYNLELFTEYEWAEFSEAAVRSVRDAVIARAGETVYDMTLTCALAAASDKADVIYHFLVRALANGPDTVHYRSDPFVARFQAIFTRTVNEAHHWIEFLRFHPVSELPSSPAAVLAAHITPDAFVVPLLMPHFTDRFPTEAFTVYDETHDACGVHPPGGAWYLLHELHRLHPGTAALLRQVPQGDGMPSMKIRAPKPTDDTPVPADDAASAWNIDELWQIFFQSIAIPERENRTLQRNLMPLRFRSTICGDGRRRTPDGRPGPR